MSSDLRLLSVVVLVVALSMLGSLVAWHERHYSKRRLLLLENRVRGIEELLLEDRTV